MGTAGLNSVEVMLQGFRRSLACAVQTPYITEAAQLAHISKSAFVADAARLAAQRVIARSNTTLMASELFDSMMATLDTPDDAPGLAGIAALPRLIAQ